MDYDRFGFTQLFAKYGASDIYVVRPVKISFYKILLYYKVKNKMLNLQKETKSTK